MNKPVQHIGKTWIIFCILLISLLVYSFAGYNYFLGSVQKTQIKLVTPVLVYLIFYWVKRDNYPDSFKKIIFGFFSVSLGFLFAWLLRDILGNIPWVDYESVFGWAISKLSEVIPICLPVLCLGRYYGESLQSLGMKGGEIGLSLVYGVVASVLSFIQYIAQRGVSFSLTAYQFLAWLPWLVLFSVSNSFMEELIFRGLFLKKYSELFGERESLILVSFIFAAFHVALLSFMGWSMVLVFIGFLFIQSYVWGSILQKTKSIWGAVLAHSIADILFLLVVFTSG